MKFLNYSQANESGGKKKKKKKKHGHQNMLYMG